MQPNEHEAVNEFFNKLPNKVEEKEADILGLKPLEVKSDKDDDNEDIEPELKNRHIRRLEKKIQDEREASIVLAERVRALSETEKFTQENPNVNPDIARMFDTSDVGKENALRLSRILEENNKKAEERAFERLQEAQQNSSQEEREEVSKASDYIDNQLESLEERYGVKLTLGTKTTNEFLQLVENLSPKDEDGEILEYADFDTTFEIYQDLAKSKKPDNSRAREVASRSMQRSQSSAPVAKPRTAGWDGWKVDMGL